MELTPELQLLIERSLNAYFWSFIILNTLAFMIMFTDTYEEYRENAIKNGTYFNGRGMNSSLLRWVLFILSIYYS